MIKKNRFSDPGTESVVEAFGGFAAQTRPKKTKGAKKAKDNGEKAKAAKPVAEEVIAKVAEAVSADHELGKRVKELRDTGMAWWQIAYQLEMQGSGPNVASGKAGAARARAAYKKTFGELPGDVARRSTKATRAAGESTMPVGRRKCVFSEDQLEDDAALEEAVVGKHLRWLGSTPYGFEPGALITEREARVHPDGVKITRNGDGSYGPMLHFREMDLAKKDKRAEQWRSVYAQDVYDIRR